MTITLKNGQLSDQVSIKDRGLAFGDGVFTTGKVIDGNLAMRDQHVERLIDSCEHLKLPNVDFKALNREVDHVLSQIPLGTYVLKIMVTAGISARGYARDLNAKANRYIQVLDFPSSYALWQQRGINLGLASTKLGINPFLAGIKHLNRLEQVMVKCELTESNYDDLIVLDINGRVTESSVGNVFWQKDNIWFTPIMSNAGVDGLLKRSLIARGFDVMEISAQLDDLENVSSMFVTNCLMGIVPVRNWCGKTLSITPVAELQKSYSYA